MCLCVYICICQQFCIVCLYVIACLWHMHSKTMARHNNGDIFTVTAMIEKYWFLSVIICKAEGLTLKNKQWMLLQICDLLQCCRIHHTGKASLLLCLPSAGVNKVTNNIYSSPPTYLPEYIGQLNLNSLEKWMTHCLLVSTQLFIQHLKRAGGELCPITMRV